MSARREGFDVTFTSVGLAEREREIDTRDKRDEQGRGQEQSNCMLLLSDAPLATDAMVKSSARTHPQRRPCTTYRGTHPSLSLTRSCHSGCAARMQAPETLTWPLVASQSPLLWPQHWRSRSRLTMSPLALRLEAAPVPQSAPLLRLPTSRLEAALVGLPLTALSLPQEALGLEAASVPLARAVLSLLLLPVLCAPRSRCDSPSPCPRSVAARTRGCTDRGLGARASDTRRARAMGRS